MYKVRLQCAVAPLIVAVCGSFELSDALGQIPSNYGSYYTQNSGTRGAVSSNRYLYDKYFYHNTAVSPYLNLGRSGGDFATSYQTYVRPEMERREAASASQRAYVQQRKLQGNVGHTAYPGAGFIGGTASDARLKPAMPAKPTPSAYHNHWYGGWANR
jgi:hypothetical protein